MFPMRLLLKTDTALPLLRSRCWFQQPARQIAMPVHGSTEDDVLVPHFIEQEMLPEGTNRDHEPPVL
jgi:hypothetical protein